MKKSQAGLPADNPFQDLIDRVADSHQRAIVDMEVALANLAWAVENCNRLLGRHQGFD